MVMAMVTYQYEFKLKQHINDVISSKYHSKGETWYSRNYVHSKWGCSITSL